LKINKSSILYILIKKIVNKIRILFPRNLNNSFDKMHRRLSSLVYENESLQEQINDLRGNIQEDQDSPPFPFFSNASFNNINKFSTINLNDFDLGLQVGRADPRKLFDSNLCRVEDVLNEEFIDISVNKLKHPPCTNRKLWEWVYIYYMLARYQKLNSFSSGLGFGVGSERLASAFTAAGAKILATDAPVSAVIGQGWETKNQHATSLQQLHYSELVDYSIFSKNCKFDALDMNDYASIPTGYDFHWSSCVIEHLGGISQGLDFLIHSSKKLNAGGIAVHTTEFNLSSGIETADNSGTCIFRKLDFNNLAQEANQHGLQLEPMIYDPGSHFLDYFVDSPPYSDVHLRLILERYVSTSIGIVIRKKAN